MKSAKQFRPNRGGLGTHTRFNGRLKIDRMYDTDWLNYSRKFLAINQECYACGKKSEVTDHLVPHKGDDKLFKQLDNHIPLCKKCHNTITAKFDRRFVKGHTITPKLQWMADEREMRDLTSRVKVMAEYP